MARWSPLPSRPTVAVLRLQGVIAAGGRRGAGMNDAALAPLIEKAFSKGRPEAVALTINSPGGSPAQSSLIAARIRRLADEKEIPVHAFVEDVAASGGYWLATAADKIWADQTSILGSIGVISAGFGFSELIARHGIERRVHTAGKSKSFLDPFQPEKPEDVERLQALFEPMHRIFIDQVKARRGSRLSSEAELFDGSFWLGQQAVDLGLADGIAHLVPKMKALYGDKVRFRTYGPKRGLLRRLGAEALSGVAAEAEDRALMARFGL
ncbi:S49 family peptidase [Acidimangrovimonas sediminis]|uniref:S49 family peptidase n=1 Tax=Acidimangrovimonas sediminis TaxID=2056283 RepID=UPI000C7FF96D|nr:S49 family peptidase [Acidimangrovimonas sediminis]